MRLLRWLLLAGMVLGAAREAAAQDEDLVRDVILEGNVLVDHQLILNNLRVRPGVHYDKGLLDESLRWLHDFYGILPTASIERTPQGVTVTIRMKRIRRYDFVKFEGNEEFSDASLGSVARLGRSRGATVHEVQTGQALVNDHYLEKGFPFVQVEVRSVEQEDGLFSAVIRVFEGPQTEIDALRIEGLTVLDVDDARDLMRSAPGFWAWLVGKNYVRADVDRDILVLEDFVRREGYLDARVSLDDLEWTEDREEVVVTLLVEQGQRYTVRDIRVTGNTALSSEELLEGAALVEGSPYRRPNVARVQRAMQDRYGHEGYIDVRVSPHETFDLTDPVLDLEWRVDEGLQKTVRDVIVRGNVGTRDGVVRRYMTVYPGDVVDTRELRYSEDQLVSLGYFTDQTGIPRVRVSAQDTDDPRYVDVYVDVDDSSSGVFTFLVGAGSDQGVFGGVTIDKRNFDIGRAPTTWKRFLHEFFERGEAFHGGGQRLFLEVVPGTETTNIDIAFQDPWLDETREDPWGLTTEVYDHRRVFSEYTRDNTGLGVFFDHRFSRETSISLGPRIERVDISDVDQDQADIITGEITEFAKAEGARARHVLEGVFRFSDVDSLFEPTDGFTTQFRLEQVGGPLGGEIDAVRAQWSGEWFVPMGEDDEGNIRVLHPRFAVGVVEETGSADDLPFYENYFVGGGTGPFAVRGFDFQGVGPHQELKPSPLGGFVLDETDGNAVGGRLAAVASIEGLFPLVTQYNPFRDREEILVKGVLFLDAGNLVPDTSLGDLSSDVRLATGAGLRLRLPALGGITILLDWAVVLAKEDEDETRALSFELSRRF